MALFARSFGRLGLRKGPLPTICHLGQIAESFRICSMSVRPGAQPYPFGRQPSEIASKWLKHHPLAHKGYTFCPSCGARLSTIGCNKLQLGGISIQIQQFASRVRRDHLTSNNYQPHGTSPSLELDRCQADWFAPIARIRTIPCPNTQRDSAHNVHPCPHAHKITK